MKMRSKAHRIGAACGSSPVWGTVRLEPLHRAMTCRTVLVCRGLASTLAFGGGCGRLRVVCNPSHKHDHCGFNYKRSRPWIQRDPALARRARPT